MGIMNEMEHGTKGLRLREWAMRNTTNIARIVVIAFFVVLAVWAIVLDHYDLVISNSELGLLLTTALISVGPELAGIVVGVVTIDFLNERRQVEQLKTQLIREMGASDRGIAGRAVKELRAHGWLTDGTLSEVDLTYANLEGVPYLYGVCMPKAQLWGAKLSKADIRIANLSQANLSGASLDEANLTGANLSGANLEGASLRGAKLWGAKLTDAKMKADFTKANLTKADLSGADLEGATFDEADLTDAKVNDGDLMCLTESLDGTILPCGITYNKWMEGWQNGLEARDKS
jgi:hypothetical protein